MTITVRAKIISKFKALESLLWTFTIHPKTDQHFLPQKWPRPEWSWPSSWIFGMSLMLWQPLGSLGTFFFTGHPSGAIPGHCLVDWHRLERPGRLFSSRLAMLFSWSGFWPIDPMLLRLAKLGRLLRLMRLVRKLKGFDATWQQQHRFLWVSFGHWKWDQNMDKAV